MPFAYVLLGADVESLKQLSSQLFANDPEAVIRIFPGNPIASLDPLPAELAQSNLTLARIIALVDATLIERQANLKPWFDALTHFADVLLLTKTKEVSPSWFNALKKSLKDRPLEIFPWPEVLKKNSSSANAVIADITFPEARRLSQHFESEATTAAAPIYIGDNSEDSEGLDDLTDEEEKIAADELDEIPLDPYFERDLAGRYVIKILAP